MSSIYNLEPITKGKVLLYTSHGDIEIELWARETPKSCRNFVQLCLEGYYDNVIFHRLVKGFCLQGGDSTGTGSGGESIYGGDFKDEFHQRLKFNRRGLVAMANEGSANTNTSQFFITLGEAPELQNKHTIFGKVAGNTIYNVLRMEELETDSNDRPLEPPLIKSVEVINNPFDDIVPRDIKHKPDTKEPEKKKKKSRMKATKNYKLLSFGDEAAEDEEQIEEATEKIGKIASAHDKGNDAKLSQDVAVTDEQLVRDREVIKSQAEEIRMKLKRENSLATESLILPLTAKKQEKLKQIKDQSEKLINDIKLIGKKDKEKRIEEVQDNDKDLDEKEKRIVNVFRREQKETKEKFKESKKTISVRRKGHEKLLDNFKLGFKKSQTKPEVILDDTIEEDEDEDMLNSINLRSHSLIYEERKAKVKDANVMNDDTYEIYDPRHPINKRKRMKQKDKPNEKWKKTKMLT